MWNDMLDVQVPLVDAILRAVLVYVAIVILIRIAGRRGLAEMSTFDIAVVLLMAEIVGGAAVGDDNSLTGAAIGALTLVAMDTGFNRLVHRSSLASRIFQGTPATVIRDGNLVEGALHKLRISQSELVHAIRGQHGDDLGEVDHAELTPSGKLVLTLKPDEQSATKGDIATLMEELRTLRTLVTATPGPNDV
jgi:uncharacterized membrane protein YcaP (DUF421 family)